MSSLQRVACAAGRAGVMVAIVATALTGLTACDAGSPSERPAGPTPSTPAVAQPTAPSTMPEVPLRQLYAQGTRSDGVLVSAAGTTETGRRAVAFVPTQQGVVFTTGDRVYDLVDGGLAVAVGPVSQQSVFLQVDPTLRYVVWEVRRADGVHSRAIVYDSVTQRRVMDRVLLWADRSSPLRITGFGAAGLRLVHLPQWGFWTFATVSDHTLTTPGGQVVDLRSHQVEGPRVSRGVWSPGLRYRVSAARGQRPWQVVDLTTEDDVTPAALLDPTLRSAQLTGWLGDETFGVLISSGTWRHTSIEAQVCHVSGSCREVWRHPLGADDARLQSSDEID